VKKSSNELPATREDGAVDRQLSSKSLHGVRVGLTGSGSRSATLLSGLTATPTPHPPPTDTANAASFPSSSSSSSPLPSASSWASLTPSRKRSAEPAIRPVGPGAVAQRVEGLGSRLQSDSETKDPSSSVATMANDPARGKEMTPSAAAISTAAGIGTSPPPPTSAAALLSPPMTPDNRGAGRVAEAASATTPPQNSLVTPQPQPKALPPGGEGAPASSGRTLLGGEGRVPRAPVAR
ncbi:unnamed protein product, partial [Discosporangium mesarthrocarpum]